MVLEELSHNHWLSDVVMHQAVLQHSADLTPRPPRLVRNTSPFRVKLGITLRPHRNGNLNEQMANGGE